MLTALCFIVTINAYILCVYYMCTHIYIHIYILIYVNKQESEKELLCSPDYIKIHNSPASASWVTGSWELRLQVYFNTPGTLLVQNKQISVTWKPIDCMMPHVFYSTEIMSFSDPQTRSQARGYQSTLVHLLCMDETSGLCPGTWVCTKHLLDYPDTHKTASVVYMGCISGSNVISTEILKDV